MTGQRVQKLDERIGGLPDGRREDHIRHQDEALNLGRPSAARRIGPGTLDEVDLDRRRCTERRRFRDNGIAVDLPAALLVDDDCRRAVEHDVGADDGELGGTIQDRCLVNDNRIAIGIRVESVGVVVDHIDMGQIRELDPAERARVQNIRRDRPQRRRRRVDGQTLPEDRETVHPEILQIEARRTAEAEPCRTRDRESLDQLTILRDRDSDRRLADIHLQRAVRGLGEDQLVA